MAWTQADLDAINRAIADGAKRVRFQTHEVEYQSMTDLLRARDVIRADVDATAPATGSIFAEYHDGY
ncbi:hypothetical protein G6L78_01365 [Agrobacterium rhizogenes]|nr:hypothetical protein [Rhizobium rhizogenes]